MASIITGAMSALLEFDEISTEVTEDKVRYTILTTGILPKACELKVLLWSYLAPPVKRLNIISIEEVESGPITKRYKIVVEGDRYWRGRRPEQRLLGSRFRGLRR